MIGLRKPTAIELFSGAGGMSLGIKKAGFEVILANEVEKDFAQTFAWNHPQTKMLCSSIEEIDFRQALKTLSPDNIDLLSGGPPCQGFSTIGSKKESDPRNRLFYQYLRAVDEIQPNYVIFENVAGFCSLYKGVVYQTLLEKLNGLGYKTQSGLLEASDFGLPQIRKRTIIVGWKKSLPPVRLPEPTYSSDETWFPLRKKRTLMDALSDLPELRFKDTKIFYKKPPENDYQHQLRHGCHTLTEHNSSDYGKKMREILSLVPAGGTVNDLPERLRPRKYFSNTYARLLPDQPCPTITRNFGTPSSSRCVHPFQNRALSTREGARLQGFPDSYRFFGSKTSKNLQIGNAVPPILGEVIAREILKSMNQSKRKKPLFHQNSVDSCLPLVS